MAFAKKNIPQSSNKLLKLLVLTEIQSFMTIGIWGIKDSNAPSLTESQIETQLQVAN
jgi:hypothetical protein